MLKRTISICLVVQAFNCAVAFSRQSKNLAPELPVFSLCRLVSHPDRYEDRKVRVQARLESVYLYSQIIGFVLTDAECEHLDAQFEKAEDEVALLNRLRDAGVDQAQVTVVGKLRGPQWPESGSNIGLKGIPRFQLVIETVSSVEPLTKNR
jgi:hypothetical protein